MSQNLIFSLTALLALVPAALFPYGRLLGPSGMAGGAPPRPAYFWAALALAVAGPVVWSASLLDDRWHAGVATTLWVAVAASMVLFAALCLATRSAWRLTPLLLPYLLVVGALATLVYDAPQPGLHGGAPGVWIDLHIAVSVVTYALLTLAAVAAAAAFLQQRALKAKRPTPLTRFLPPVAESDRLQVRLLAASELVLGLGLATGMAVLHYEHGVLLRPDHKTLLSLATFVVIGALLAAHARTGVRGRTAARYVLMAYLLLTLGYPGVKFVSDILLG